MVKRKFFTALLIILILAGGAMLEIRLSGRTEKTEQKKAAVFSRSANEPEECQIKAGERIVRGNSLAPLIEDGQAVRVLFGYYDCNEIQRGDVVLYSYAGNEAPLIKIVKGIPEDGFALAETEQGGWHILINNKILKNSEGIPYLISGKRYEMLALYEKDYKGEIPGGAYLLLGNITSGVTDSTRFGLDGRSGILGKAEY